VKRVIGPPTPSVQDGGPDPSPRLHGSGTSSLPGTSNPRVSVASCSANSVGFPSRAHMLVNSACHEPL
jgi:hypothetical protein